MSDRRHPAGDEFRSVAGQIVLAVVLTLVTAAGVFCWDAHLCSQRAGALGLEHRYELVEGCLVRTVGGAYEPLRDAP